MKMRSSAASFGIVMWLLPGLAPDHGSGDMAEPYRHETRDHGDHDIGAGPQPLAVAREVESLQAERRERRVAATQSDHQEDARVCGQKPTAIGSAQCADAADDERAGDVDQH